MCVMNLYGINFDTETKEVFRTVQGFGGIAAISFKKLYACGITRKSVIDIMVNEVIRERLNLDNFSEVMKVQYEVTKCLTYLPASTIIILRSLYYDFEEIYKLSSTVKKLGIDEWLQQEGLDNPEIEKVCGVNSTKWSKDYVNYKRLKVA